MSTSFGDVLDLWGAARLISAAATRGDGLGMSTRLALVAGARRAELLEARWPDLMWPDASGGCGTLLVACQNGGKTVVGALGYALSRGWPRASGRASAGSTRLVSAIAVHGNVILTAAGTDIAVHRPAALREQECASCCSISGNSDGGRQIG